MRLALAGLVGVTACGATPKGRVSPVVAPGSSCQPAPGQTDLGLNDSAPLPPDGYGVSSIGDYPAGSTTEILSGSDGVLVVQVVSRGAPEAVARTTAVGAGPPTAHAGPTPANFTVLRPATFATMRIIKGAAPACFQLEVPGGTSGDYQDIDSSFPASLRPGQRFLAFTSPADSHGGGAIRASQMFAVDPAGRVKLPFGDRVPVDVSTLTIPPAPPAQPVPPGAVSPSATPSASGPLESVGGRRGN